MTEDELAALLHALEQGLTEVGLPSLVEQERVVAAEGTAEEPTAEDVEGVREQWDATQGAKRFTRPRVDDVRIRPLDTRERLAHLLDLLEVAIGGSYAIEMHLRSDLEMALGSDVEMNIVSPSDQWNGQIEFAIPDEAVLEPIRQVTWNLPDQKTLQVREGPVRRVISLIDQLRAEVGAARSSYLQRLPASGDGIFDPEFPGGWS